MVALSLVEYTIPGNCFTYGHLRHFTLAFHMVTGGRNYSLTIELHDRASFNQMIANHEIAFRNQVTLIILISLMAVSACMMVICAMQAFAPFSYLPEGFVVHACFGSTGQGLLRVGAWWISPYIRDVPRWAFVTPAFPSCAFIPWLPFLPQYGTLMIP